MSGETIKNLVSSLRIKYSGKSYNAIKHNCNNFTNDVLKYLNNYKVWEEREFVLPAEINRAASIVKVFPDTYNTIKNYINNLINEKIR